MTFCLKKLLLLASAVLLKQKGGAKVKKNVLLITSDQQHYNTIGAFNSEIRTPNLDRLVKEGMTFNRAYCPNPTCTPTRGSIITGKYPSQHGGWSLGTKVDENQNTLGDELIKNGYRTALVGKAHFHPLQSTEEYPSLEAYPTLQDIDFWRRFNDEHDRWYGFQHCQLLRNHTTEAHVGQHYVLWLEEKGCKNWRDYFVKPTGNLEYRKRRKWEIPEEFHYDNFIAEKSNELIEEYAKNDEPFFLWSSFFDPHPDYEVPEPYYSMYDREKLTIPISHAKEHLNNPPHYQMAKEKNADFSVYCESGFADHGFHFHDDNEEDVRENTAIYYGMVTMMDKYIGKILDKLDELQIAQDTLVIFTTDHGHLLGHHGLVAKGPFMYEDMIKVPMIIRQNEAIPQNMVSGAMQSLVDLAPTILSMTDNTIPYDMTGINQHKVWTGERTSVRNHAIVEHRHEPTKIHLKTYVNERYKLTVYYNQTYGELYDLENDPKENNNLWDNEGYRNIKQDLLMKYIWAELGKEELSMPRIANA